ncbi:FANCI solenoid 2-domain-containing protein [Entophlyctis helioformis]|nr:FANCI solenoid 2-domain-containing protein [Entophlyctis helioformis]
MLLQLLLDVMAVQADRPSLDNTVLASMSSSLLSKMHKVPLDAVIHGLSRIVSAMQSGKHLPAKAFEIMAAMLSAIGQVHKLTLSTKSGQELEEPEADSAALSTDNAQTDRQRVLSGAECKSAFISRILAAQWSPSTALHIVSALTDLELKESHVNMLATKALHSFEIVPDEDKPKLAHTLILLSKKGGKCAVLAGISKALNTWACHSMADDEQTVLKRRIRATILTNVSFAVRHDQALCLDFVKWIREDYTRLLADCNLAILLLATQVPRFEATVLDLISASVKTWLEAFERTKSIAWLSEKLQQHFQCLDDQLMSLIDPLAFGEFGITDQIVTGMLRLACHLIDTTNGTSKKRVDPIQHRKIEIAQSIFIAVFKLHPYMQRAVLDTLFDRMLFKSDASTHAVHILEALCAGTGVQLSLHTALIKEFLGNVFAMPVAVSKRFLAALSPFIARESSLFDAAMLVLRKGSFQRELAVRDVALCGLFALLGQMGLPEVHEAGASTHTAPGTRDDHPSREIIGYLRRFLSQQYEVRERLYDGLLGLTSTNASLCETILSILWMQLDQYIDSNADGLHLEMCSARKPGGGSEPLEPLGVLFHACSLVLSKTGTSGTVQSEHHRITEKLLRVIGAYTKLHVGDLVSLEPTHEGGDTEVQHLERLQLQLQLVIGIYEAMLGHCFLHGDGSKEWGDFAVSLFKRLQELKLAMKDVQAKGKMMLRDRRAAGISVITLEVCAPIICNVFQNDGQPDGEMGQFLLSAAGARLTHLAKESQLVSVSVFIDCQSIGQTIFKSFMARPVQELHYDKKLFALAFECFEKCHGLIKDNFEPRYLEWFMSVLGLDVSLQALNPQSAARGCVVADPAEMEIVAAKIIGALQIPLRSLFGQSAYTKLGS